MCYFGANLLHGKCKADFASLPPAHRGAFLDACSNALDGLAARGPECFLAARRLCLVLAAGSARCGPERVDALVQRANALAESGLDGRLEADENASADEHASSSSARQRVALALELQAGVAEEVADLADPHARSSVSTGTFAPTVALMLVCTDVKRQSAATIRQPPPMRTGWPKFWVKIAQSRSVNFLNR